MAKSRQKNIGKAWQLEKGKTTYFHSGIETSGEIPRRCDEKMTMIRYENGDNPCLIHKGNIEKFGLDTMNNPQRAYPAIQLYFH
jgi:hypothetical protein